MSSSPIILGPAGRIFDFLAVAFCISGVLGGHFLKVMQVCRTTTAASYAEAADSRACSNTIQRFARFQQTNAAMNKRLKPRRMFIEEKSAIYRVERASGWNALPEQAFGNTTSTSYSAANAPCQQCYQRITLLLIFCGPIVGILA